jgi:hypothetical protein
MIARTIRDSAYRQQEIQNDPIENSHTGGGHFVEQLLDGQKHQGRNTTSTWHTNEHKGQVKFVNRPGVPKLEPVGI